MLKQKFNSFKALT